MRFYDEHVIEWGTIAARQGLADADRLQPGDRRDGPDRAARRRGYEPGSLRYAAYTACYAAALRWRPMTTDPRTRLILEIRP